MNFHRAFDFTQQWAVSAGVILAVVLFMIGLSSCSSFQDRKNLRYDCSVECADCKDFKMRCDSNLKSNKDGEDKGVDIINDLRGLMK